MLRRQAAREKRHATTVCKETDQLAPKISVYITSYNQKDYLIEATDSVLAQTLSPHQIIIIDDCSTDGSQEVIAGYAARHPELITAIYHTCNKGISATRAKALEAVTGDLVTFLDGDDRFLPEKLEIEVRALAENPYARIAFSDYYYISPDGTRVGVWADGVSPPEGDVFCDIFARNFPRQALFRSELVDYRAWRLVGFNDPRFSTFGDFEMRIRLAKALPAVYTGEPTNEYRIGVNGLSCLKAAEHLDNLERAIEKNRHLLDDLTEERREHVRRGLYSFLNPFAIQALRQATDDRGNGSRLDALRYYLKAIKYSSGRFNCRSAVNSLLGREADVGDDFGGWDWQAGLRHEEGPYSQWDLPIVRWGVGSSTKLQFTTRGKQMTLHAICGQHQLPRQMIKICLNGEPIHRQQFDAPFEFYEITIPLKSRAGRNLLSIEYETQDDTDEQFPMALLFKKLRIDPFEKHNAKR
jgi:glycosyltransferase involved in cell wall biosynthesis